MTINHSSIIQIHPMVMHQRVRN